MASTENGEGVSRARSFVRVGKSVFLGERRVLAPMLARASWADPMRPGRPMTLSSPGRRARRGAR
jgi:hypothetical protein